MKVEATWRGEGRLELLLSGVQPADASRIIDTIEAAAVTPDEPPMLGPVGYAAGWPGSPLSPAVFHRWSGRYMSDCHRWKADAATGPFEPYRDENVCRECERAA